LAISFRLGEHLAEVGALMRKYRNVPMSLADACLVRMTETEQDAFVITTDHDFTVYRRLRNRVVPAILPER
jgi:predicted nucleic acid-binding protein